MVYQICDMISISTWDGAFLNVSFGPQLVTGHQTWPIDRYK